MTTLTDSLHTKVVSYTALKALNDTAILRDYNRSFEWDKLVDVISMEHRFPLQGLMLHDYGNDTAVRCQVVLNHEGNTGWLDVPLELFNDLVTADDFMEEMEEEHD